MNYTVIYSPLVSCEDIPGLPKSVKARIKRAIELRLMTRPEVYGKPLSQSLKNSWKLRVGDYRVIFCVAGKTVKIWTIGHRSIVYAMALKRLLAGLQ